MLLKKKVKEIGIIDKKEYLQKVRDYKVFNNITNPEKKYKEYWVNWYDFLSIDTSGFIQTKKEWKEYCNQLGINELNYTNKAKLIKELPMMPSEFYPNFTNITTELTESKKRIRRSTCIAYKN
jgi:hypothetical protein